MTFIVIHQVLVEFPSVGKPARIYRDYPITKWNENTSIGADPGYIILGVMILDDDQHRRFMAGLNQPPPGQVIIPPSPHDAQAEFDAGVALRTGQRRYG